jgi:hypothetical protein
MMERWDPTDTKTWIGCPYRGCHVPNPEGYALRCKERFNDELEERRLVEARCRGDEPLPSHDVELLIRAFADRVAIRDRKRFELRAALVNSLDRRSLGIVYRLFDDLYSMRAVRSRWFDVMASQHLC